MCVSSYIAGAGDISFIYYCTKITCILNSNTAFSFCDNACHLSDPTPLLSQVFFVVAAKQTARFMRLLRHAGRIGRLKCHTIANTGANFTSSRSHRTSTIRGSCRRVWRVKWVEELVMQYLVDKDCIPSSWDCRPMPDQTIRKHFPKPELNFCSTSRTALCDHSRL